MNIISRKKRTFLIEWQRGKQSLVNKRSLEKFSTRFLRFDDSRRGFGAEEECTALLSKQKNWPATVQTQLTTPGERAPEPIREFESRIFPRSKFPTTSTNSIGSHGTTGCFHQFEPANYALNSRSCSTVVRLFSLCFRPPPLSLSLSLSRHVPC